jgi:hypothetical protein
MRLSILYEGRLRDGDADRYKWWLSFGIAVEMSRSIWTVVLCDIDKPVSCACIIPAENIACHPFMDEESLVYELPAEGPRPE